MLLKSILTVYELVAHYIIGIGEICCSPRIVAECWLKAALSLWLASELRLLQIVAVNFWTQRNFWYM